ncbi:MAG: 23S rRNA (guanosine(2251)-2'-O)-methyltransferase RlmB [Deltaproteobacteria bacterium HGW-Deltaproteobacteria-14]|jgi:23S rRNA (guanosine2251-2'-O)-methyltransferase|nr:MAG: 23S rRNA (guanosine(2251)-2'-O)-methyltransferase RlmB [Deltaproteobacteria bacterium HGW-Deltaproteobacteria-14]
MSRIYGTNAVEELLDAAPQAIDRIIWTPGSGHAVDALVARARELGLRLEEGRGPQQRERAGGRGGAAIGADLRPPPPLELEALRPDDVDPAPLVIALDQVTDPHNLGAILRSAAAFGARAVVVPKDNSAPLNDAAVRASAGAVAYVPVIRVTNLARALRQLRDQGLWTIAADAGGDATLWDVDLTAPTAVVLGAEGRGLRPGVKKACDLVAALPLTGAVRSLNVSVTAGVALAEAARQRRGGR